MTILKLALDWTPNTNHIGFFIAKELGFYSDVDIELEILNPKEDNYAMTPGKKLELDLADFAIAPFETVISLNNKTNKVNAVAIYAILQEDLSAIASLKSANITSPKNLDGKIYASYKARYEDHIVKEMIKNDGGTGNILINYPEKLGIWNTLLEGKADATWIFDNWEGVEAATKGIELHQFSMKDFNVPYCYSPIILAKQEHVEQYKDVYSNFVKATQQGFLYVKNNIEASKEILAKYVTEYDLKNIDLEKSLQMSAPYFGDASKCGQMKKERVTNFLKWLVDNDLESKKILSQYLFTNELFT
ncbi:ABC transporter substrate-binding protein [Polaribacter sp. R77954]|uniref:ABC transporter substrate-binding protein n=1 Tax=Polaribacter sp. R77954 TaxID=3093870 RepID=UPI0037C5FA31